MKPSCMFTRLAAAVMVLSVLLTGCVGSRLNRLEPPRINLSNIMMTEAKALETAFELELRIINPNDVALNITGIDCSLQINGKPFATGVSAVDRMVPAFGTDTIGVTVYSSVIDTVNRVIGMVRDLQTSQKIGNLEYGLTGKLMLNGDASPSRMAFTSQGALNLGELPDIKTRESLNR
jgi:LEA14-like dessication related protein